MLHKVTIPIRNPQQHVEDYVETNEHNATNPLLVNTAVAQQGLQCISASLKCERDQLHIPVTTLY
jgi:hypothetical protein